MAKCEVCGKNSLLPEKFGELNVCKICYLKAAGPLWKKKYDRREDLEPNRIYALNSAKQANFPQHVIDAIEEFFTFQANAMVECDCCGQPVQTLLSLGEAQLCKRCYWKINDFAWLKTEYDDNEEVEQNRQRTLDIAKKHSFPAAAIAGINQHYDDYIQEGLICTVDGGEGQKLKVYKDHCLILTDNDDFDEEHIAVEYAKALKKRQSGSGMMTNDMAKSLARKALTSGIISAGLSFVTASAIEAAADKYVPEKATVQKPRNKCRIDYRTYTNVEYQKSSSDTIGFLRFINGNRGADSSNDVLFFFYSSTSKLESAYEYICDSMERVANTQAAAAQKTVSQQTSNVGSVADEILKFKQLLDMGAITQEEFDAKKKELLNL